MSKNKRFLQKVQMQEEEDRQDYEDVDICGYETPISCKSDQKSPQANVVPPIVFQTEQQIYAINRNRNNASRRT